MVILLLGAERNARHESKRLDEPGKLELPEELVILHGPLRETLETRRDPILIQPLDVAHRCTAQSNPITRAQ